MLIPGENDSDAELHRASEWFIENLGPDVPWNFTAFHPDFKTLEKPHTPSTTLMRAREIASSKGLHYVTLATCTTLKAEARGALVAASCSSSAIGTSWANGISRMAVADPAVIKSREFSKSSTATGERGVCQ